MGRYLDTVLSFAVLFCTGIFTSTNIWAYPAPVDVNGKVLRWDIDMNDDPITYEVVSDDEVLSYVLGNIVEDSASLWSDSNGSYLRLAAAENNPQITLNFTSNYSDPTSAGYAIFDEVDGAAKPLHCSITIATNDSYGYDALGKTVLHELGHCLGLGHSLIPEAIMSYELEKNSFALDIDDEAALSRLYPADGSDPKLPPGCGIATFQPYISVFFLLLLPLLLAFVARSCLLGRLINPALSYQNQRYNRPVSLGRQQ